MSNETTMESGGPLPAIAAAIRRERAKANLSISELAKKAGVAKSTLSQLELGIGNPSIESLWSIAGGLGVSFSRLLEPPLASVTVIRADEGERTISENGGYEATLLAACAPLVRRDIYRTRIESGTRKVSAAHPHATVEHLILMSGKARVGPIGQEIDLMPGDYASFPGDEAHSYEALLPDTWATLIIEYR